jgi:hypothetical protein
LIASLLKSHHLSFGYTLLHPGCPTKKKKTKVQEQHRGVEERAVQGSSAGDWSYASATGAFGPKSHRELWAKLSLERRQKEEKRDCSQSTRGGNRY